MQYLWSSSGLEYLACENLLLHNNNTQQQQTSAEFKWAHGKLQWHLLILKVKIWKKKGRSNKTRSVLGHCRADPRQTGGQDRGGFCTKGNLKSERRELQSPQWNGWRLLAWHRAFLIRRCPTCRPEHRHQRMHHCIWSAGNWFLEKFGAQVRGQILGPRMGGTKWVTPVSRTEIPNSAFETGECTNQESRR